MKKTTLQVLVVQTLVIAFGLSVSAQDIGPKRHNYIGFRKLEKHITPLLDKHSSQEDKKHPEYGINPFNSYCTGCTEIINKRTVDSRYFISPDTESKFFIEKSFFPLHYKNSPDDIWRTIDYRLKPQNEPGVYIASDQPTPTKCDLNRHSTSFILPDMQFEFNHDLTLYFFDEDKAYVKPEKGNYSDSNIGDEGLEVRNMWPGIDMDQTFRAGEIETDYIINKPLELPITGGYMVIEDHFTLPNGWYVAESATGLKLNNGYFAGDYKITNGSGIEFVYHRPSYFDTKAIGMLGMYNLTKDGDNYNLQMMIPIKWLNLSSNTYPIYIDPWVTPDSSITNTILGNYIKTGLPPFQFAFTDKHLGSCNDTITVPTPARTTVTEAFVAMEYQLTFSDMCGTSPNYELAPFCTVNQVSQRVISNACGVSSGNFTCQQVPNGPYIGTCTTDSNLVPGARPLKITAPGFLSCLVPSCAPDTISFTLENQDSTCDDVCGYLCARGHLYSITLVGYYLIGNDSAIGYPSNQTTITVCQGQTVNFGAAGSYGVPPYRYLWTIDGGITYDTTNGTFALTATDTSGYLVECVVIDTCGDDAQTTPINVVVLTSPPTNAGPDKYVCEGGVVTIGGNPTTPAQDTVVGWTAENAMALSWMSDTTSANPTITIPAGTIDTVFYAVQTTNGYCTNTDTVLVYSIPDPQVTIDSLGPTAFCPGQNVQLIAVSNTPVSVYQWSNGGGDSVVTIYNPGSYDVVVTDAAGCKDTSNSITVTNIGPPVFHIFPDTTIQLGDSVPIYADVQLLNNPQIDSFFWTPAASLGCTTCASPYATPPASQQYYLTVYRGGCFVSDSLLIQVILPTNFYIPNAFTPDKPGPNDQFYIYCQAGVTVMSFQVFDRTGEKVHDGTYPWDGNYRGKPAPQAVYVYKFTLSLYGEEATVFRKGSVTLLR